MSDSEQSIPQESGQQPEEQPAGMAEDDQDQARSGAHENAGAADDDGKDSGGAATGNPANAG